MSQDPEPLETVALNFNYEPGALRRAGVDPRTSEGKARIKALLIEGLLALKCENLRRENRVVHEDGQGFDDEFYAMIKSLLSDGSSPQREAKPLSAKKKASAAKKKASKAKAASPKTDKSPPREQTRPEMGKLLHKALVDRCLVAVTLTPDGVAAQDGVWKIVGTPLRRGNGTLEDFWVWLLLDVTLGHVEVHEEHMLSVQLTPADDRAAPR